MDAVWEARALGAAKAPVDLAALAERHAIKQSILKIWQKMVSGKAVPGVLAAWQAAVDAGLAAVAGGGDAVKEGLVEPPAAVVEASRKVVEQSLAALDDLERFERETAAKQEKPAPVTAENEEWIKVFLKNEALFRLSVDDAKPFFSPEVQRSVAELRDKAEAHKKAAPPELARAFGVTGGGAPMQINVRGNADQLGDLVPPGFLQVLSEAAAPPLVPVAERKKNQLPTFTRLDLAAAVATPANPLTARVYVNRVWHYLFGRGIVGTLSNFGQLGDRPTHPELLDTLAVRFIEAGWSTKWLIREIALSATYRLSSDADPRGFEFDPDNILLWRMTPRRLGFEAWRDGMLAVAGKLDATRGGAPYKNGVIPTPDDGKKKLRPEDPAHFRRTIYSFVSRFEPNPTGTLFDVPEPNVTSEQRTQTTIPQQQLFALNSPFIMAMAKAFAERVGREAVDDEGRVRLAWRLAYGRSPKADEVAAAMEYLAAERQDWERLCHALLMSNEFAFLP
jgi:flagellar motor protein MotB